MYPVINDNVLTRRLRLLLFTLAGPFPTMGSSNTKE